MKKRRLIFIFMIFTCVILITACEIIINNDGKAQTDIEKSEIEIENLETTDLEIEHETEIILTEEENNQTIFSPKEAVDLVASIYFIENDFEEFFENEYGAGYKFKDKNYYLMCEGSYEDESGKIYVVHNYQVVIDDEETGEGHTATFNWYHVNAETKEIIPMIIYDENGEVQLNEDY